MSMATKKRKHTLLYLGCMLLLSIGIIAVDSRLQSVTRKQISDHHRQDNKENTSSDANRKDTEMTETKDGRMMNYMDNKMEPFPLGYLSPMKNGGTIETVTYTTTNFTRESEPYEKKAMIYLPHGYDATDSSTKYNIIYLMHGSGDDEHFFLGDESYEESLKCILDHMIANGDLPPCIVCTPTYQNPYCTDQTECVSSFYKEFRNDLIPAVEGTYHTYYDASSMEDSRWHRSFGGFSMGAATTWWIFETCMDIVATYIPISGDSWCGGTPGQEQVAHLSEAVKKQGFSTDDFLLFYGCGDTSDIAYDTVNMQVSAMKNNEMFQFCDNYKTGNFYYNKVTEGGHDWETACTVLYNGLQRLFAEPRTRETYQQWAEGIMLDEEPKNAADNKYDYYGKQKKYHYYSQTAGRETNVNVLLPPDYSKDQTYPVLYVLHGYYDNEDWMASSMVNLKKILGNLINNGEAKDMIVVMPYIFCSPDKEECTEMNLENSLCYDNFVNDLLTDLKPFIEKKFSVATGRENTAITGFSMGGRESIFIGMTHPELFGYVGGVCPAPGLTPGSDLSQHPGQLQEEELVFSDDQAPYLFLLSAAKNDPAVGNNPFTMHGLLEKNNVAHLWNVIPEGGHDASSVRVHLYNFLRMAFRYQETKTAQK